jgi:hypothetical protein
VAQSGAILRTKKAELALAATKANLEALAREQAVQEAELEQIRADAAAELDHRAGEDDGLLQRRRADAPSSESESESGRDALPRPAPVGRAP